MVIKGLTADKHLGKHLTKPLRDHLLVDPGSTAPSPWNIKSSV